MKPLVATAWPRAGLLGNPSDLYGGKGIGFVFHNWCAEVRFQSGSGCDDNSLLEAAIEEFSARSGKPVASGCLLGNSNIPRQVGLAGSSALVIAALRVLSGIHKVDWSASQLAECAWAVENDRLGIVSGPMDRLIQAHQGLLVMDFADHAEERLSPSLLPEMRILVDSQTGQVSGDVHARIHTRFHQGDAEVCEVVAQYRPLVERGLLALLEGDLEVLADCVDKNFDLRASLYPISTRDLEMIAGVRDCGAAAKFCGSGGAVLAVARAGVDFVGLAAKARDSGWDIVVPQVEPSA